MRYGKIDTDYATRLATCPAEDDGPVYMLNLMKYRAEADYGPDGEKGVTGREADDRYAPVDILTDLGAVVCFVADVEVASEDWDRIAVVKYPSRRSFIEMQSQPRFIERHRHKDAGMDHTIVMGTLPTGALPEPADRLLLEVWSGTRPAPQGGGSEFAVEGTIIGDGRAWTGVRYRALDGAADLSVGRDDHQLVVVTPTIQHWT